MVRELLRLGADRAATNADGKTALDYTPAGDARIIELLENGPGAGGAGGAGDDDDTEDDAGDDDDDAGDDDDRVATEVHNHHKARPKPSPPPPPPPWRFATAVAKSGCGPARFRAMSFNIRYGTNDPADHAAFAWPRRRSRVLSAVFVHQPTLVGFQEVLPDQLAAFKAELGAQYHVLGVGRDDGAGRGEATAVLVHRASTKLVANGTFWLSQTPHKAGSKSFDAADCRTATWVVVELTSVLVPAGTPRRVRFINTHFDHVGEKARMEGAKQVLRWVHAGGCGPTGGPEVKCAATLLTGDLNAEANDPAIIELTKEGPRHRFIDTAEAAIGIDV